MFNDDELMEAEAILHVLSPGEPKTYRFRWKVFDAGDALEARLIVTGLNRARMSDEYEATLLIGSMKNTVALGKRVRKLFKELDRQARS